jgi:hypothetical protein
VPEVEVQHRQAKQKIKLMPDAAYINRPALTGKQDRFALVRERVLRDLVDDLDWAVETFRRGTHARKAERAGAFEAIEAVARYLLDLRERQS